MPNKKRKATASPELQHSQTTSTHPQPRNFNLHFPPHSWTPQKQPWNVTQNTSLNCTQIDKITLTYKDIQHLAPNPSHKTNHWIDANTLEGGITIFHKKSPFVTQRTYHTPNETKNFETTSTPKNNKHTKIHKTNCRRCKHTDNQTPTITPNPFTIHEPPIHRTYTYGRPIHKYIHTQFSTQPSRLKHKKLDYTYATSYLKTFKHT